MRGKIKTGDLVRMRSGKIRLVLGESLNRQRGIKMYITFMNGQYSTVPQTLLNIYGTVISENTSSI